MRPSKASVMFCYLCPNCGSEWWYDFTELKFTRGIECGCGQVLHYDPINKVTITPVYSGVKEQKQKVKSEPVAAVKAPVGGDQEGVIDALAKLGYSRTIAKRMICNVLSRTTPSSEEQLLELCLRNGGI